MFCGPPAALIGEFDVEEGPTMVYVSEYYAHTDHMESFREMHARDAVGSSEPFAPMKKIPTTETISTSPATAAVDGGTVDPVWFAYVHGETLVGQHVATGGIQPDCRSFFSRIALRALTIHVNSEEDAYHFFHEEEGFPAVASLSFCIPDICARGQNRRFCVAYLHESDRLLLTLWPLLRGRTAQLVAMWKQRCTARRETECFLLSDLLDHSGGSNAGTATAGGGRRRALRPFAVLITPTTGTGDHRQDRLGHGDEGLMELHSFFEALFPLIFSSHLVVDDGSVAHWNAFANALQVGIEAARGSTMRVQVQGETEGEEASHGASLSPVGRPPPPLAWWLFPFLLERVERGDDKTRKTEEALLLLFSALFQGTQIVVSGDSEAQTALLAQSLAWLLPPDGRLLCCRAARYHPPQQCRILSFGADFLSKWSIVPFSSPRSHDASEGILDTRTAAGQEVVHARVCRGKLMSVKALRVTEDTSALDGQEGGGLRGTPTTMAKRLLSLLKAEKSRWKEREAGGLGRARVVEETHIQMMQIILEYSVMSRLFLATTTTTTTTGGDSEGAPSLSPLSLPPSLPSSPVAAVLGNGNGVAPLLFPRFMAQDRRTYSYLSGEGGV